MLLLGVFSRGVGQSAMNGGALGYFHDGSVMPFGKIGVALGYFHDRSVGNERCGSGGFFQDAPLPP